MTQTMSRWTAPFVRLPVPGDEDATLEQDWHVEIRGWEFDLPAGIWTDGASIPRALWAVCGHPLQTPRVYAALVHDWLYGGAGPEEMTRSEADAIYRDLLIAFGWGRVRAWTEWAALRMFGWYHWAHREVLEDEE